MTVSHEVPTVVKTHARPEYEALVRQHFGMSDVQRPKLAEGDVERQVSAFEARLNASDPNDACKYLALEEYKCLVSNQHDKAESGRLCYKWFNEWRKCSWDQHKFNEGTTYIEGPQIRKPYLFAPNHKYA